LEKLVVYRIAGLALAMSACGTPAGQACSDGGCTSDAPSDARIDPPIDASDAGSEPAPGKVAYIDPAGVDPVETDPDPCPRPRPCLTIKRGLAAGRAQFELSGTTIESVVFDRGNIRVHGAPGAKLLSGAPDQAALKVQNDGTSVVVEDLTIGSRATSMTPAISVEGGSLTLMQVTVSDNMGVGIQVGGSARFAIYHSTLANNDDGGIIVMEHAGFDIRGNDFLGNGKNGSFGAIYIATSTNTGNWLEFNTFYNNGNSQSSFGVAIHCTLNVVTAKNNILAGTGAQGDAAHQIKGACGLESSLVSSGARPMGAGNLSADPRFRNPSSGDLHLLSDSPAKRAADPSADLSGPAATDFDGITRPKPASMGAHEAPP
jgi:hypothetical protein